MNKHCHVLRLGFLFCLSLSIFSCNPVDEFGDSFTSIPLKERIQGLNLSLEQADLDSSLKEGIRRLNFSLNQANLASSMPLTQEREILREEVIRKINELSSFILVLKPDDFPEQENKTIEEKANELLRPAREANFNYLNSPIEGEEGAPGITEQVALSVYRLSKFLPGEFKKIMNNLRAKMIRLDLLNAVSFEDIRGYIEGRAKEVNSLIASGFEKRLFSELSDRELSILMQAQALLDEIGEKVRLKLYEAINKHRKILAVRVENLSKRVEENKKDYNSLVAMGFYKGTSGELIRDEFDKFMNLSKDPAFLDNSSLEGLRFDDLFKKLTLNPELKNAEDANTKHAEKFKRQMISGKLSEIFDEVYHLIGKFLALKSYNIQLNLDPEDREAFNRKKSDWEKKSEALWKKTSSRNRSRMSIPLGATWLQVITPMVDELSELEADFKAFNVYIRHLKLKKNLEEAKNKLITSQIEIKDIWTYRPRTDAENPIRDGNGGESQINDELPSATSSELEPAPETNQVPEAPKPTDPEAGGEANLVASEKTEGRGQAES